MAEKDEKNSFEAQYRKPVQYVRRGISKTAVIIFVIIFILALYFYFSYLVETTDHSGVGPTSVPTTTLTNGLTTEEINDYFYEIALSTEYGNDGEQFVRKWEKDLVYVKLYGDVSARMEECVVGVISDFNEQTIETDLQISDTEEDIAIYFREKAALPAIEPNYVPGNDGFFWMWWGAEKQIFKSRVLVSTDTPPNDTARCHLLREELTQSMGLANDSGKYEASIFYDKWTSTQEYAPIDKEVIRLLYSPEIEAGMTLSEVQEILE